jgi:alkylation response protein AidB-like acyl-CoA dehydrogenase
MARRLLNLDLSEEERTILDTVDELCRREIVPVRDELDRNETFPAAIFESFRETNVFEAMFDADAGGLGLNPLMPYRIVEIIAEYCAGVATAFAATTSLATMPLKLAGTVEQKEKYMKKLVTGEWLGAFAVTEPDAGSDVLSMTTSARRTGDRYVLNGTKQWITNAALADVYLVYARTAPGKGGLSCFIVEKDAPGLTFGRLEDKLGIRCSHTRQVILTDVEVPAENLVGLKPNRALMLLFNILSHSRTCIAMLSTGLATGAYKQALICTRERRQFGQAVIRNQVVQHMLADMLMKIETAQLLAWQAARAVTLADPEAATYVALAKAHASEIAMQVATDALQLHGGYGYVKEAPIEKMFRDAKVLAIYEGTTQMLKNQVGDAILRRGAQLS